MVPSVMQSSPRDTDAKSAAGPLAVVQITPNRLDRSKGHWHSPVRGRTNSSTHQLRDQGLRQQIIAHLRTLGSEFWCDRQWSFPARLCFHVGRRMCYNRDAVKQDGKQEMAPGGLGSAAFAGSTGKQAAHQSAIEAKEDPSRYCPVCSQRLESRKCKLICNTCGYYMSCADYY